MGVRRSIKYEYYIAWYWFGFTEVDFKYFMIDTRLNKRQAFKLIDKWLEFDKVNKGVCYYTQDNFLEGVTN